MEPSVIPTPDESADRIRSNRPPLFIHMHHRADRMLESLNGDGFNVTCRLPLIRYAGLRRSAALTGRRITFT